MRRGLYALTAAAAVMALAAPTAGALEPTPGLDQVTQNASTVIQGGNGAAASGAGIAALLLATFLLAAPAIRRRLLAPSSGHWPAAPVFLLERPG